MHHSDRNEPYGFQQMKKEHTHPLLLPGGHLNIKMSSYQYRDPHVKDKTVWRLSYL